MNLSQKPFKSLADIKRSMRMGTAWFTTFVDHEGRALRQVLRYIERVNSNSVRFSAATDSNGDYVHASNHFFAQRAQYRLSTQAGKFTALSANGAVYAIYERAEWLDGKAQKKAG